MARLIKQFIAPAIVAAFCVVMLGVPKTSFAAIVEFNQTINDASFSSSSVLAQQWFSLGLSGFIQSVAFKVKANNTNQRYVFARINCYTNSSFTSACSGGNPQADYDYIALSDTNIHLFTFNYSETAYELDPTKYYIIFPYICEQASPPTKTSGKYGIGGCASSNNTWYGSATDVYPDAVAKNGSGGTLSGVADLYFYLFNTTTDTGTLTLDAPATGTTQTVGNTVAFSGTCVVGDDVVITVSDTTADYPEAVVQITTPCQTGGVYTGYDIFWNSDFSATAHQYVDGLRKTSNTNTFTLNVSGNPILAPANVSGITGVTLTDNPFLNFVYEKLNSLVERVQNVPPMAYFYQIKTAIDNASKTPTTAPTLVVNTAYFGTVTLLNTADATTWLGATPWTNLWLLVKYALWLAFVVYVYERVVKFYD